MSVVFAQQERIEDITSDLPTLIKCLICRDRHANLVADTQKQQTAFGTVDGDLGWHHTSLFKF